VAYRAFALNISPTLSPCLSLTLFLTLLPSLSLTLSLALSRTPAHSLAHSLAHSPPPEAEVVREAYRAFALNVAVYREVPRTPEAREIATTSTNCEAVLRRARIQGS